MEGFIDYTSSVGGEVGDLSNYYTKGQVTTLVNNSINNALQKDELELTYKKAYDTGYKEFIKEGGKLTRIDVYTNSGKSTKLFTKVFSYAPYGLATITTTDEITGYEMSVSFSYQDGSIVSSNKTYGA